MFFWVSFID